MHSPIMAVANGTPAIHLRQPTDTRKGQMWRDVGLGDWLFEVEPATGEQIAARLLEVHQDPGGGEGDWSRRRGRSQPERGERMMKAVAEAMQGES